MLIAMSQNPDGVEQVRLANNMGYLGDTPADNAKLFGPPAPAAPSGASAQDQARQWVDTLTRGVTAVMPLLQKPVNCKKTPTDPRCQPTYDPKMNSSFGRGGEDDSMSTYLLIGGGVLLGGVVLYSMFKKKKKKGK